MGAVPIFYSLTANASKHQRLQQAKKVALNASSIIAFFFVTGQAILDFWGISLGVLQIAGGLLIARTAWTFAETNQYQTVTNSQEVTQAKDIALIPMAVPLISGPGAIGLVIGLAAENPQWSNYLGGLLGIAMLGITLYLCLVWGELLVKVFGQSGIRVLSQVLGFFILAISIQLLADGIFALLQESGLS
ncbi:MAG: MarC family protein [Calothrix sp. MO_192.B10]|nr:MarC family protein [Calothrix sp. MO_192.B10]